MKMSLAVVALLAFMSVAVSRPICAGQRCGDALIANGWTKTASCAGHAWSYLLEKNGKIVICRGVSATHGLIEWPCEDFSGDPQEYRVVTAKFAAAGGEGCWPYPPSTDQPGR